MAKQHRTILISEPQDVDNRYPFLPYMWAVLKSYWERYGDGAEYCEWLPPITENDDASKLLDAYGESRFDVLGLSCYTWNWNVQCEIAAESKARNPDVLVVAG